MSEFKSKRPTIQGTNHADNFNTDPAALWPLLPYLNPEWCIWESACGIERTPLATWLRLEGFTVVASDLRQGDSTGSDFLSESPFQGVFDCIITNPPYSIKDQWIARCYELGKPFALLLPYTAMEGIKRQALYRRHGIDLLVLPKRVKFTTPSGKQGGAWFPCAWFTWKILPERLIFAE